MRTEAEIFKELETLCTTPGYVHVLACLSFRDNFLRPRSQEVTSDDFYRLRQRTQQQYDRLIPIEISTLIGLAVKGEFNVNPISSGEIERSVEKTDDLMRELNMLLTYQFKVEKDQDGNLIFPDEADFKQARTMRNHMFYEVGSAYLFHYKKFTSARYTPDNEWFQIHQGFSIQEAQDVIKALSDMQLRKVKAVRNDIQKNITSDLIPLEIFMFTLEEIAERSNRPVQTVKNVVDAFCLSQKPCNQTFNSIVDYNEAKSHPIIKISDNEYLLLQVSNLIESMYESPFYWMDKDEKYKDRADKHRGIFTEEFCANRLESVFGARNVYKNIVFEKDKGEIDVLVTYLNRAIILQAKSKKLTLKARQGDEKALGDDFQSAVQDAYNQGFSCAELLNDKDLKISVNGKPLEIRRDFREIYIFTVVPDHFPSLAFQAEQKLEYKITETIPPPFVMDIFLLDTLCELLESPLYFLDFVRKRIKYSNKIMALSEVAILGYYLRRNLYIPDDLGFIPIDDNFCRYIESAMHVRRENLIGNPNVEGILTKWEGHTFGEIIQYIKQSEQDGLLDIGFFLLRLNENVAGSLGDSIDKITRQTQVDKKLHAIHQVFDGEGFAFYTSYQEEDADWLYHHCELRKYLVKANKWFGLAKNVNSGYPFDVGLILDDPWKHSDEMEKRVNILKRIESNPKKKIGRNDPCPCGSGKKYKKCHGKTV